MQNSENRQQVSERISDEDENFRKLVDYEGEQKGDEIK